MRDEERYTRWRRASTALLLVEPKLMQTVRALGRIDAELFLKDIRYREIREKNDGSQEEWEEMADHSFPMAYLWTLAAYEVIRMLDERFQRSGKHAAGSYRGSTALKHDFTRIRIPLAKLEPAKRHKQTDYTFAHPALIAGRGIGWSVADGVHICRGELSTSFLEFLESMRLVTPE